MGMSPLDPQTMYSACWRKRPFWGRLLPLSQTAVPRQIQPAHWRASVAAGSCRQSMNIHTGAPGLQIFLASYSHSAAQRVHDRWSLASPSKGGGAWSPMLEYFLAVDLFFSAWVRPPDA